MSEKNPPDSNFMTKLATFIVDKKTLFFLLYIFAVIFCAFSSGWVNVENDVTTYLPEDTETRQGIVAMNDNFTTFATAQIMVSNVTYETAEELSKQIEDVEGVSMVTFDDTPDHYTNASALFDISFDGVVSDEISEQALSDVEALMDGYDYCVYSDVGYDENATLQGEMSVILIIAVVIIIVVLTLTSRSYAEVPVLMITFGVAIACWITDATYYTYIYFPAAQLVALIATIILSVTMARRIERMSVGTAKAMFIAFSALFGFTLSIYLYIYELQSVIFVFLATSVYFGVLAVYGHLTKRDLSSLRTILFSGLIFLIVFEIVTLFIPGFTMLDQVVCLIGIAVFLGYTAYDTQKIRAYYSYYAGYPDMLAKASIFSALQLYLDFVNIFLYLLRLLGRRSSN